jgi:hypothetical protein
MRAEFFVNFPMLSFSEQMQVDFTHDWSVAVGVARDSLRIVQARNAKFVIEIARCPRNSHLEEPVAMNLAHLDGRLSIREDVDLLRVGAENADANIVPHTMRSQNPKRIGMCSGKEATYLRRR